MRRRQRARPVARAAARALGPAAAAWLALALPSGAVAQEGKGAGDAGAPNRSGAFVYAEQGGRSLLVAPDTASSLNEGTRIFFRCSGGQREVYLASTRERLGNAREGAAGRYRFGDLPWSELSRWGSNESGSAAFMPPRFAPTFADRARDAETVEIEVVNPAGVRHRYVFRLDGFAEGAAKLDCFTDGGEDG